MTTEPNGSPAPREPLRLDLEDIRCWLLEQIDGGEDVKGHDSMLSTYINTIDNALAALSSEIAEPRGCPTPGACSAVAELADLKQRILPQANGRAQRAEKARQMAVAERDEMLEKLIVRQTTIANLHDVIDGMRGAARSATGATDRPDWAQQLPGAKIFDRSNDAKDAVRYRWIREQYYYPPGTLLDQAIDAAIREESDK